MKHMQRMTPWLVLWVLVLALVLPAITVSSAPQGLTMRFNLHLDIGDVGNVDCKGAAVAIVPVSITQTMITCLGPEIVPTIIPVTSTPKPTATAGEPTLAPTSTSVATATSTSAPAATATAVATAVITATPTITPTLPPVNASVGVCGEDNNFWHPAVINGCETGHEHGDAPPAWIVAAGYNASFSGAMNTTAKENQSADDVTRGKHTSMKGVLFNITVGGLPMDVYLRGHFSAVPFERAGEVHSVEYWVRYQGEVSHFQHWVLAGTNILQANDSANQGRCLFFDPAFPAASCDLSGSGSKIELTTLPAAQKNILGEQWYIRPPRALTNSGNGGWGPAFLQVNLDWLIYPSPTLWQPEELTVGTDLWDVTRWLIMPQSVASGVHLGQQRQMGISVDFSGAGSDPRAGNTLTDFWINQFGQFGKLEPGTNKLTLISGPLDPMCNGSLFGTTSIAQNLTHPYTNTCMPIHISRLLPSFNTGVIARDYIAPGLKLPN